MTFGGEFRNKRLESRFLFSVKQDYLLQNKIGIGVTGLGYMLVGYADYLRVGYSPVLYELLGARLLFFLYCTYVYAIFKPNIAYRTFFWHTLCFSIGNLSLVLFLIYNLNHDKQLDLIDAITMPFIAQMLLAYIQLRLKYLITIVLGSMLVYMLILLDMHNTPAEFKFTIMILFMVLLIGGFYLVKIINISRRKGFLQFLQITSLNEQLHTKSINLELQLSKVDSINKTLEQKLQQTSSNDTLIFESESKNEKLILHSNDLICIKAEGNYSSFYYDDGGKTNVRLLRLSLKNAETMVESNPTFLRSHRSYIINITKVENITAAGSNFQIWVAGLTDPLPASKQNIADLKLDEERTR